VDTLSAAFLATLSAVGLGNVAFLMHDPPPPPEKKIGMVEWFLVASGVVAVCLVVFLLSRFVLWCRERKASFIEDVEVSASNLIEDIKESFEAEKDLIGRRVSVRDPDGDAGDKWMAASITSYANGKMFAQPDGWPQAHEFGEHRSIEEYNRQEAEAAKAKRKAEEEEDKKKKDAAEARAKLQAEESEKVSEWTITTQASSHLIRRETSKMSGIVDTKPAGAKIRGVPKKDANNRTWLKLVEGAEETAEHARYMLVEEFGKTFLSKAVEKGSHVTVKEPFVSGDTKEKSIPKDQCGIVNSLDDAGDAEINFDGLGDYIVGKQNFHKLQVQ
jgi:hypothetical protein